MKKFIFLTLVAFAFSNCEIKVREASANNSAENQLVTEYRTIDGMRYLIIRHVGQTTGTYWSAGGVTIVNLTKDKLEVELLQKQIAQIK